MAKKLGTLKTKRLFLGTDSGGRGTEVTSSAAELNIMDGVTSTGAEIDVATSMFSNLTAGSVYPGEAVVTNGNKNISQFNDITTNRLLFRSDNGIGGGFFMCDIRAEDVTATATFVINFPSPPLANAVLLGCNVKVAQALAGGDTWDAAYSGGNTTAIATAQAVTLNTEVISPFDVNAAAATCNAETNITITKNGGGSFTAQGNFVAAIYYFQFPSIV